MNRAHWAALSAVVAMGIATLAGARHEDEGFSNESLEGTWSYIGQFGLFVPPVVEEPTPATTIGMIEFDGDGGCSVRGLINTLGETAELDSSECEYSVEASGPDHDRRFTATVVVGDVSMTGNGSSKKTAEMAAALSAWRVLNDRA